MAEYFFESSNEGQFLKTIDHLKKLDADILVKTKREINPFESDLSAIIDIDANYEEVLSQLSLIKNIDRTLETIRPLQ